MTNDEAAAELTRRYGAGKFKLEESSTTGVRSILVTIAGWPTMVRAADGYTWEEALARAASFRFFVHREKGWCLPMTEKPTPTAVAALKGGLLKFHNLRASGATRVYWVDRGVAHRAVVGEFLRLLDNQSPQGVVVTIGLGEGSFGIVTTERGLFQGVPLQISARDIIGEAAYQQMANTRRPGR